MRLYRILNYLSIDVACGAMVCAAFFASVLHVQLRPVGIAALGVTVWIIYTLDRLLDVHRLKRAASSERHRFHQRNFKLLAILVTIAATVNLVLLFFIRTPILYGGMGLSLLVLLYLTLQPYFTRVKEFVTALLYTGGIVLPAFTLASQSFSHRELWVVVSFSITALINLILFSWYGWEEDLRDNQTSIVTFLGKRRGKKLLIFLFLIQLLFLSALAVLGSLAELSVLLVMNAVLLILFMIPGTFSRNELYRLIGDVVFIFPLLYLFLSDVRL